MNNNKHKKKVASQEIGLELGLIFGKYFVKTESLHFGYWTDTLPVDIANLPKAQENYDQFLISHIPEGVKSILDVGCGVGVLARKLLDLGYQVDCVSPSPLLTEHTRSLLGKESHIFECCYERLETEKQYDLILFSESFQYLDLEKALPKSFKLLNEGGYLLICDFFKTSVEGKGVLGGGHKLVKFYELISRFPFQVIKDIDITKETSPNLKIVNDLLTDVAFPIWKLLIYFLDNNYPFFSRFLKWKYRKKIEKINQKYFTGARNAENFSIFKSYRLLLYRK